MPLEKLHEALADPRLADSSNPEGPDGFLKLVLSNVTFYGSWFPEETRHQFDLAHQTLQQKGETPCANLMGLERVYAPNSERFLTWMKQSVDTWIRHYGGYKSFGGDELSSLGEIASVADSWKNDLTPKQIIKVHETFAPVIPVIKGQGVEWRGVGFLSRLFFEMKIERLAGRESTEPNPEEILTRTFLLKNLKRF